MRLRRKNFEIKQKKKAEESRNKKLAELHSYRKLLDEQMIGNETGCSCST